MDFPETSGGITVYDDFGAPAGNKTGILELPQSIVTVQIEISLNPVSFDALMKPR
jgi:hypothetical protein